MRRALHRVLFVLISVSAFLSIGGAFAAIDSTPPVSYIVIPSHRSVFLPATDILFFGTAQDSGGSSIQKVDISLDSGLTWQAARAKADVDGALFWEFVWRNPPAGDYSIKSRATDWWDNIEEPRTGIQIKVLAPRPRLSPSPSVSPLGLPLRLQKPIERLTAEERNEAISILTSQLKYLLLKVIALMEAELKRFSKFL